MQVPIKKQKNGDTTEYVVPAIAITGGEKKLIPNPAGNDVCRFATLEEAKAAIERAGFDATFDGVTTVNIGHLPRLSSHSGGLRPPRLSTTLNEQLKQKLVGLLNDREAPVVVAAVQALANWQHIPAINPLCQQLGHNDPTVRKEVSTTLAKMAPHSLPALKEAYRLASASIDGNAPYIRAAVLYAFQCLLQDKHQDSMDFLPTVLAGLTDDHWVVRSQAACSAAYISVV